MAARVLIVDDDRLMRQVLGDLLRENGFVVIEAVDGREACERCLRASPDAVILDLVMPVMDGAETCRTLRKQPQFRHLPILMLTSRVDSPGTVNPFTLGADDYLAKPFDAEDLLARLQACIIKKNAQEALETRARDYRALLDISESIADSVETGQILRRIVRKIAGHIADIERCSIAVIQEDGAAGYILASSDDDSLRELRIDLGNYPEIRQVIESGEPLLVTDIESDPLFDRVRHLLIDRDFNAVLVLPVHHQQRVIGVMVLRARRERPALSPSEIEFCQLIADVAAGPLTNARFFSHLRRESAALRQAKSVLEDELRIKAIYEELFDNASDGLVAVNAAGQIEFVNRRALEMVGLTRDELQGALVENLLDRPALRRAIVCWRSGRGEEEGGRVRFDLVMQTRNRGRRCFSVSANREPVLNDLTIVAFRDVTEKRRMEAELRQTHAHLAESNRRLRELDRFRAEFLNTATHELRVPVTIVHGYCALLRDSLGNALNGSQREFLDAAFESSERLVDLVNNMLDLSRFEAGKMRIDMGPNDIVDTVFEVCHDLGSIAEKEGLTLRIDPPPERKALFDRQTIQRVLVNLLSNAIKFTPAGGEVRIRFDRNEHELLVSVEDTGKGIPAEQLPQLFDEFTQVGRDDARRGSGLGLSICRKIVESHGGRIWAESRPGCGSRFTFTLPLA
ncbi:PAS domain S-box-containing protein [Geothermobacter ehrlichii]|uniref:histidine kinase n=1 Tax=Geothermobacter ehrlichii TaxID=213224 RepID=A0A5D3WN04_9BACT|nr:ATP-binding protein [Geothermobacter ehrlichii]TYO99595.1 PAS domain S-box-containing protein [Geothermobacter ehrlichii]